ncbi:MAG TPA: CARDB domain-containing protein [Candidatus Limnocylindria bacterium]|nr:CARDB domain-containing protein [Candidatus Limnocylindria bacterium]
MRTRLIAALAALLVTIGSVQLVAGHDSIDPVPAVGGTSNPAVAPHENVEWVSGDAGFTGGHVTVEGDRLYVGSYGAGFNIYSLANPADPVRIGGYLPGERADAVPDAAVFDGRHIAVLNGTSRVSGPVMEIRTDRSEFLDVTDPANPVKLAEFVGPADGEAHNGDIVDVRRTWLPSGGRGVQGLRIYDLNPLLGATPAAPVNLFRGDPVALWQASPYRAGKAVGPVFSHTHDISVYTDYPVDGLGARDIALLAEGGNYTGDGNTGSIFVIDITDPRNPVVLQRWFHAAGPGHHPIRYFHEAQFLDGDPRVMLVTDEDLHNGCGAAGGVTAVRLTGDLTGATELSEWFIPAGTPAPVCSAHVFNTVGDLMFMGSYNAGLQVIDYADPANPVQAGYYIAEGSTAWGAYALGDYVYVGDMSRGLDVFHFSQPDLAIGAGDLAFSSRKVVGGDQVTVTATVRNVGDRAAANVVVRFTDNGARIGTDQLIASIPAGGSASASVVWDTRGLRGDHVIAATADPDGAISEADESNNRASSTITVRGNKVRNGSFEQSSTGAAPDQWTASGDTTYASGGSDGARSVTAEPGGSWTSAPIAVEAGRTYQLSVAISGIGAGLAVEQLSAGTVVGTLGIALPPPSAGFNVATAAVTVPAGVSELRIRLAGPVLGYVAFDDVRLWEE